MGHLQVQELGLPRGLLRKFLVHVSYGKWPLGRSQKLVISIQCPQITMLRGLCSCVSPGTPFINKFSCFPWVVAEEGLLTRACRTLSWVTGQPWHLGVRKILEISWEEGCSAPLGACILFWEREREGERDDSIWPKVSIKVRFCTPLVYIL